MESIKKFLTGMLVRWLLKIAGTYFATIGFQTGTVEEIVGGIVAFLIAVVISLFQHFKALDIIPELK